MIFILDIVALAAIAVAVFLLKAPAKTAAIVATKEAEVAAVVETVKTDVTKL